MRETPVHPARATGYFLHTQTPGPAFQNVQLSLSLGETCEAARLEAAWKQIVAAHEILRSGFAVKPGGELVQRVHDSQGNPWRQLDWSNVPPAELSERWKNFVAEDMTQPIDASQPPLLRITAIALPGGHCHLLITFPRFLLDEDALFHILCEWLEALDGRPPTPDVTGEKESNSSDIADWWAKFFEGAGRPSSLKLSPLPIPVKPGDQREQIDHLVDRESTREIKAHAQKLGISPRDVILGAWALLLGRFGGQGETLLLASCPTNAPLLDPCENLLPLRAAFKPETTIEKWLKDFSSADKDRAAHAGIALDRALTKSGRKAPEFPVTFLWSPPSLNDRLHDAFPRWINLDAQLTASALHPLALRVADGNRFAFRLDYDPALYPPAEAQTLFQRFMRTLDAMLEDSSKPLSSINVLTEAEEKGVPPKAKDSLPKAESTLLDRIAKIAAKQPESIAVVGQDDVALPFAELDAHATALANYLGKENLFNGWNIAVCLTPTLWVPVAVLGVLRAGNTCVPLDPNSHVDWLAERVSACDAELVICDSRTAALFHGSPAKILIIDQQWETVAEGGSPETKFESAKVALLLNGTSLDVAAPLRALSPELMAQACEAAIKLWEIKPQDRIALSSAPGTVAFAEILLTALASGATLVLSEDGQLATNVSHLRLSSLQWRDWLSRLPREDTSLPEPLRTVCIEASPVPSRLLGDWEELAGDRVKTIFFLSPLGFSGLGVRTEKLPALFPHENPIGHAADGVRAEFKDALGIPLPSHHEATLKISLPGFEPTVTVPAWTDRSGEFHLGRRSDDYVAEILSGLAEIQDAVVKDSTALVILKNETTDIATVTAAAREKLPERLQPKSFKSLAHFPLTPGGAMHWEALNPPKPVPQKAAPAPAPAPAAAPTPHEPEEPAPTAPTPVRAKWQPIVPLRADADAPLLVLVHDTEGDPSRYGILARLLEDDWSLHATIARELYEPLADPQTLETEAATYCKAIRALDPDGPYHLIGHGYGAVLAFEMTRQLRAAGCQVPYLALAGAAAPQGVTTGWMQRLSRAITTVTGKDAQRSSGSPIALAHEAALKNYRAAPLDGAGCVILGADQSQAEAEWLDLLPEAFVEHMSCPAQDMLTEPSVRRLAVILRECADPGDDSGE